MDSKIIGLILFFFFYFLTQCHESYAGTLDFESPSPSPFPYPITSPSPSPVPGPGRDGCWRQLMSCHNRSLTACVVPSSTVSKQLLYVKNEGESSLRVNVTISHAERIFQHLEIQLPKHQFRKVNISKIIGGSSSIQLDSGDFGCVIHIKSSPSSGGRIWWTDISPVKGAYSLFLTGLVVVGVTRACCCKQLANKSPYRDSGMGHPGSPSRTRLQW